MTSWPRPRGPHTGRSSTTTRASPRSSARSRRSASCPTCGSGRGRRRAAGRDERPDRSTELRAIPWTFAWSQARINLPGWYGLGSALEAYRAAHGEAGLDEIARLARDWPFLSSLLDNAEMSLAKADMGVARLYAALATRTRRRPPLGRDRGRIPADGARSWHGSPVASGCSTARPSSSARSALRNPYVDSLSELQVRLLARLRALAADDPDRGARPAARPADGQRRRGRAPEHRLARGPRATTSRCSGPAVGARAARGRTSAPGRARSRSPWRTCSDPAGGSWPSTATAGARGERGGGARALPGDGPDDARRRPRRGPLDLPELDGLVAANSLHYVPRERQVTVIRPSAAHLRPGGSFVVVEYDADRGNPWVPHPFSAASWGRLAAEAGLVETRRSAACRAGSSARSTRRSAAAPEGCLTTGVA